MDCEEVVVVGLVGGWRWDAHPKEHCEEMDTAAGGSCPLHRPAARFSAQHWVSRQGEGERKQVIWDPTSQLQLFLKQFYSLWLLLPNLYVELRFAVSCNFLDAFNKVFGGITFEVLLDCPGMKRFLMLELLKLSVGVVSHRAIKCLNCAYK